MARPPIDGSATLVTGASSGIGRELARLLAGRVGTLVVVARRTERLEELAAELRGRHEGLIVRVETCDLSDPGSIDRMLASIADAVGPIDILVNNAGLGDIGLFETCDWAKVERMIGVNVVGLTYLTRRLLPAMIEKGAGGILNIGSGFGLTWMPGVAAYAATKHYVNGFSEALRCELKGTGVVVTQSCPGPVATEFEAVAGNPTGQRVPSLIELSAARCADRSLAAFARGRRVVVPGFVLSQLMRLDGATPRWLLHLVYGWMGPWLRRRARANPTVA